MVERDITELIAIAIGEMGVNELVHSEAFNLKASMCAIELMDERMDSGMHMLNYNNHNETPLQLADQFLAQIEQLNNEKVEQFMVCMFKQLYGWMACGNTLAQTVWTCALVHIQEAQWPKDTNNWHCNLIRKVVRLVKVLVVSVIDVVSLAAVNYDEDLLVDMYGVQFDGLAAGDLQQVVSNLQQQLQDCSALSNRGAELVRLMCLLGQIVQVLVDSSSNVKGSRDAEWECCQLLISQAKSFTQKLIIADQQENDNEVWGFHNKLFRNFTTHMPPRSIKALIASECFMLIDNQLSIFSNLAKFCVRQIGYTLDDLFNYLQSFADQNNCPLSRSFMRLLLGSDDCVLLQYSLRQMIQEAVTDFSNPPYYDSAFLNDETVQMHVRQFFSRVALCVHDLWRVYCLNRGRSRRNMIKAVHLWDHLQIEAEQIDGWLHRYVYGIGGDGAAVAEPYFLSLWVYTTKLKMMQQHLWMGFSKGMELYQQHELPLIYWYQDFLIQCTYQNIVRVEQFKHKPPLSITTSKKASKKLQALADRYEPSAVSLCLNLLMSYQQEYCKALSRLLMALKKSGLLVGREWLIPDESCQSVFHYRFGKFQQLSSPEQLQIQQFEKFFELPAVDLVGSAKLSYANIKTILIRIKTMLEKDICASWLSDRSWTGDRIANEMKAAFSQEILCSVLVTKLNDTSCKLSDTDMVVVEFASNGIKFPKFSLIKKQAQ